MSALGWNFRKENHDALRALGTEPAVLFGKFKEDFPAHNSAADPLDIVNILNQGQIGSCQGQSLAKMFQICWFLKSGRVENFSAMAGYILAQEYDGLLGRDVGSTLSGGQKVAQDHGLCLEEQWPYPNRYDRREPAGAEFNFQLTSARPTSDPEVVQEAIELGLPVQTGLIWNSDMEQPHIESYNSRRGAGGHSTTFWQGRQINSWGADWNDEGTNTYSQKALEQMVTARDSVFVIYAPEQMEAPPRPPIASYD